MKPFCMTAAVVALTVGAVSAASAQTGYQLSPVGTSFTASGTVAISSPDGNLSCNLKLRGTTAPDQIHSATFSGARGCSSITAAKLPWGYKAHTPTAAELLHVVLISPVIGQCGQNELQTRVRDGAITINDLLPSRKSGETCVVKASLSTSPTLTISTR